MWIETQDRVVVNTDRMIAAKVWHNGFTDVDDPREYIVQASFGFDVDGVEMTTRLARFETEAEARDMLRAFRRLLNNVVDDVDTGAWTGPKGGPNEL